MISRQKYLYSMFQVNEQLFSHREGCTPLSGKGQLACDTDRKLIVNRDGGLLGLKLVRNCL